MMNPFLSEDDPNGSFVTQKEASVNLMLLRYCQLSVQEKFVSESFFSSPFLSHSPWAWGIIFDSAETEQVEGEAMRNGAKSRKTETSITHSLFSLRSLCI